MSSKSRNNRSRGNGQGNERMPEQCFSTTLDNVSVKNLIEIAEKEAVRYRHKIKANQIRNFYGAVNKLKLLYEQNGDEILLKEKLILLLPQLAYAGGRNSKTKPFIKCMDEAIRYTLEASDLKKAIKHFFVFVESVVAYHKYYGDK